VNADPRPGANVVVICTFIRILNPHCPHRSRVVLDFRSVYIGKRVLACFALYPTGNKGPPMHGGSLTLADASCGLRAKYAYKEKQMSVDKAKDTPPKKAITENKIVEAKPESSTKMENKPDATPKKQGIGEGQKPVSKAYKDNWNDIFGKKKKR
jgi:hypothetical protein